MPRSIATALSSGKATMTELSTTVGLEGLHDILEVVMIDAHNARVAAKKRRENQ